MAGAVVATMALTTLLPDEVRLSARWVVPALEGALLVALIVGDPGAIDRRSRQLRALSILLVSVLVVGALISTGLLIDDLIHGGKATGSAGELLATGSIVWAVNNLAFALLYWELDSGGAAARAQEPRAVVDLAFVQHVNPELAAPGWRPRFADYLYLSYTNATAFSPTDTMPLAAWAKLAMTVQSIVSLAILGLVVARAVNVLT
jgi:uncharacterized membrane protein